MRLLEAVRSLTSNHPSPTKTYDFGSGSEKEQFEMDPAKYVK